MSNTILLSIDASDQAKNAIDFYLETVHRPGYDVILLHVIELPDLAHARDFSITPSALHELWIEQEAKSKVLEEKCRKMFVEKGLTRVTFRRERGLKPGQVVVAVAKEMQVRMVVMGTRGLGFLRRTIMGSVSTYVLNHAHCPVLICRPKKQQRLPTTDDDDDEAI